MRNRQISYTFRDSYVVHNYRKNNLITRLTSFLCVFMYFMSPYRLFGHAMPEIIGVVAILLLLTQTDNFVILKGYGAYMLYILIIPPIISLLTNLPGDYLTSFIPINLIFYSIAFCFLLPNADKDYVLKYYKILVYCSIGLFIIQEISFYMIGSRPTLYLPLEMYYEGSDTTSFSESRSLMDRSSSFFLEPAHFAQYILPYFCIVSYNCLKHKTITKELLIMGFTLLLLQSGSGYLGLLIVFISVLFSKGIVSSQIKLSILVFVLLLICIIGVFLYNNVYVIELLNRMNEVTTFEVKAHGSQSGFLRIWRGYIIYDSYMNGVQALLISGGIVGTVLFIRFIKKCWNFFNPEGIIILVCMLAMFFIEHMLFTPKMFLFILIAFAVTESSKRKNIRCV